MGFAVNPLVWYHRIGSPLAAAPLEGSSDSLAGVACRWDSGERSHEARVAE